MSGDSGSLPPEKASRLKSAARGRLGGPGWFRLRFPWFSFSSSAPCSGSSGGQAQVTEAERVEDAHEPFAKASISGSTETGITCCCSPKTGRTAASSLKISSKRPARYVADHPELINVTWVDSRYVIHDVAPLEGNRQIIGLSLNLPEPKRASHLAREQRQPVYTRPFEAIQGKMSFEIWVPVFPRRSFPGPFRRRVFVRQAHGGCPSCHHRTGSPDARRRQPGAVLGNDPAVRATEHADGPGVAVDAARDTTSRCDCRATAPRSGVGKSPCCRSSASR